MKKSKQFTVISLTIFLGLSQQLRAEENEHAEYGKGLLMPTEEELAHHAQQWGRIEKVNPNKLGAARIKMHHEKNKIRKPAPVAYSLHEEWVAVIGDEEIPDLGESQDFVLPRYIDNSQLPSFPPIGHQQRLSSCVGWGTTYYQATHETGLANGTNNKVSQKEVLSPKWTYNLCNGGRDGGLQFSDAYSLLHRSGAMSIAKLPYDSNYLSWHTNSQDWTWALSYRMSPCVMVGGINEDPQNLTETKTLLANGHVLTLGTFIGSWVYTTVKPDSSSSNRWLGQQAVTSCVGQAGPHCMTIVGYDDDIWIDVNGNGVVDPGEMGAFLIANSWGNQWGNKGFMWVSYDAFRPTSSVPGVAGPDAGRVSLSVLPYLMSAKALAPHYTPALIAQFHITQLERNQVAVQLGASPVTTHSISSSLSTVLNNQGGRFSFDGGHPTPSHPETGSFAFDLTDLLQKDPSNHRFYLRISEKEQSSLQFFALYDPLHNATMPYVGPLPVNIASHAIATPRIDYIVPNAFQRQAAIDIAPLDAQITSPREKDKVSAVITVTVSARPPVSIVEFYLDDTLLETDQEAPFLILLDTTKWKNGEHLLKAVARDAGARRVTSEIHISFDN